MILKLYGNNRKSTSGRKDCIKGKNTERKSSVLKICSSVTKPKQCFREPFTSATLCATIRPDERKKSEDFFLFQPSKKLTRGGDMLYLQ